MATRRKVVGKARGKFSDTTRARIFAWDRGVCALTGANLWILDYGLSSLEQEDWADHIRPVARGGSHLAQNGVCVSAGANYTKGANGRANEYWFVGGRPTYRYFSDLGKVPEETARWLKRDVRERDWYSNRALRNLMLAVSAHGRDVEGYKRHEDRLYYPRAALRFLTEFRMIWEKETRRRFSRPSVANDWTERGLLSIEPHADQQALLELLDLQDEEAIDSLVRKVAKRYARNCAWIKKMDEWTRSCDPGKGLRLIVALESDSGVSPLVRDLVKHNVTVLSGLPKPDRAEAARGTTRRCAEYA